jgi:CHAD domain-containing protein
MKKTALHGFRIYRQEPLPETFRRVIQEQLQQSLLLCEQFPEDPDFAVHEIRKSTKRIRAVYRLFRQVTGNVLYLHGREFYSNLSHVLAEHRISRVHCDTLQLISADRRLQVNKGYLDRLIKELEKRHKQFTINLFKKQQTDQYLSGIISAEKETINEYYLLSCNFHDLTPGLRKTYSGARKYLGQVLQLPIAENFHELRKMVKSLWNELILIRPIWPSYYSFAVHHLDILAQKLGYEHDLAELEKLLREETTRKDENQRILIIDFITKKRQQVQKLVIPAARRLFTDKPGVVARRMEMCYDLFVR